MSANAPIDLCDSSDDDADDFQRAIRMSLAGGVTSSSCGKTDTPNLKRSMSVVPVTSSDTKKEKRKSITTTSLSPGQKKKKTNTTTTSSSTSKSKKAPNECDDDDDVMVIEKEKMSLPVLDMAGKALGADEDLVVVGEQRNNLPHARSDCLTHRFNKANLSATGNKMHCGTCYCFVCDTKVAECSNWGGHFAASADSSKWIRLRAEKRRLKNILSAPIVRAPAPPPAALGIPAFVRAPAPPPAALGIPTFGNVAAALLDNIMGRTPSAALTSMPAKTESNARWHQAATECLKNFDLYLKGKNPLTAAQIKSIRESCYQAVARNVALNSNGYTQIFPGSGSIKCHSSFNGPWQTRPVTGTLVYEHKLVQCQHCQWWSNPNLEPSIYMSSRQSRSLVVETGRFTTSCARVPIQIRASRDPGPSDWCHACARVMKATSLGKVKAPNLTPAENNLSAMANRQIYCLGSIDVKFKLHVRDPRKCTFAKSESYWSNKELGFVYDKVSTTIETFKHRIGAFPSAAALVAMISKDGKVPPISPPRNDRGGMQNFAELDAIVFEDDNHAKLFDILADNDKKFVRRNPDGALEDTRPIAYKTSASISGTTGEGTVKLSLYVRSEPLFKSPGVESHFTSLSSAIIGLWFGIFPFRLSDLHPIKLPTISSKYAANPEHSLAKRAVRSKMKGYGDENTLIKDALKKVAKHEAAIVKRHNLAVKKWRKNVGLGEEAPSQSQSQDDEDENDRDEEVVFVGGEPNRSYTGSKKWRGGVALKDTTLSGLYKALAKEVIAEGRYSFDTESPTVDWYNHQKKTHKQGISAYYDDAHLLPASILLHSDDIPLWEVNAQMDIKKGRSDKRTLTGILNSLENVGHAKYPHVEGLTVELHDYQKQAVGFMLDREKLDNRKLLWAKLPPCPGTGGTADTLYFSPMLGCFSREPEAIGKGGFLCEEMGLGKTVISLATILSNPAPAVPVSCQTVTPVPNLSTAPAAVAGWSPHARLADDGNGAMYHRGTLVVCHVSLVGQWIDEAKKKLKDPGLVYPYHGSSRTKDPKVLGQKSIVVTTYATLASDDTYHRKSHIKHSPLTPYVPICGKFKWWRIILDESHAMKSTATNHSRAVKSLVAENRWCVTGTPFNNTLADISNQMAFLNIAPFTSPAVFNMVFGKPYESLTRHMYNRRRGATGQASMSMLPKYAIFLSLMRSFMMRHSKDQKNVLTNLGLVSLPPKTQKTIYIDFSSEEQRIYGEMEKAAKAVYLRHRTTVMKNTLYLLSTMTPLRDVCSGGAIPLSGGGHARHQPDRNEIIGAVSKSWRSNPAYKMTTNDSTECAICLDVLDEPVAVMCNPSSHVFCRECIEGIIVAEDDAKEGNCPLCRAEIKLKNFRKAEMPDTGVKVEKGKEIEGSSSGLDLSKLKGLKDHGPGFMFDSKLKKLVAELKRIAKEEPTSKSLIFSQFVSTLAWLKIELPRHGFSFRTLEGNMSRSQRTKALREFQGDPPTTIFLLSLRAGAVGINLTEANRVFLMEPALNPALEAQAIGRVHRLGQVNAVEITRFAIKGSIEERILKLQQKKYGSKAIGGGGDGGKAGANGGAPANGGGAARIHETRGNNGAAPGLNIDDDDDDDDKFLEANGAGHLNADKMTAKTEEFDLIFGVTAADLEMRRQARQPPRAPPPPPPVAGGDPHGGGHGPQRGEGGLRRGHPPKAAPPIVEMPKRKDDDNNDDDDDDDDDDDGPRWEPAVSEKSKKAPPKKEKKDDDEYNDDGFSDSE